VCGGWGSWGLNRPKWLVTWQPLVGMVAMQPLCAVAGTRLGEVVPQRAEAQEWCIGAMGEWNLKACDEDDMVW
jgi:hypothetical protein